MVSAWSQIRPERTEIRRSEKYSGLTMPRRACCSSFATVTVAEIVERATRVSSPLAGGVARVEMAVESTPGIAATC